MLLYSFISLVPGAVGVTVVPGTIYFYRILGSFSRNLFVHLDASFGSSSFSASFLYRRFIFAFCSSFPDDTESFLFFLLVYPFFFSYRMGVSELFLVFVLVAWLVFLFLFVGFPLLFLIFSFSYSHIYLLFIYLYILLSFSLSLPPSFSSPPSRSLLFSLSLFFSLGLFFLFRF